MHDCTVNSGTALSMCVKFDVAMLWGVTLCALVYVMGIPASV